MPVLPILLVFTLVGCRTNDETSCNDQKDNDVDGMVDCEDPDCRDKPACRDSGGETGCEPGTWYPDADGDGYGDPTHGTNACTCPTGFVEDHTDCDDGDAALTPADADTDGFSTCQADCDDADPLDWPGAVTVRGGLALTCIGHGTFTMGSPEAELGHEHDEDQHEVHLTHNIEIGVYEVTQSEFAERMGYNDSFHTDCDACPVEEVTWSEAAAFANAVSALVGLSSCYTCTGSGSAVVCDEDPRWPTPYDCPGYRLPTEAEWEYAARAGDAYAYAGSNEPDVVAWHEGNASTSQPVGTRLPNAWLLYDMSGNVWEWTADRYREDITSLVEDPWVSEGTGREARGGAFSLAAPNARVSYRNYFSYDDRNYGLGFRLSR